MSNTAVDTLELLERRLARLEFYLDGSSSDGNRAAVNDKTDAESVVSALTRLYSRFTATCSRHPETNDILQLHALLQDGLGRDGQELSPSAIHDHQLPVVLASENVFQPTASQLTELQQHEIPASKTLVSLIALQPRIARAKVIETQLTSEMEQLRKRSATVLERWYESTVLQNGQRWIERESRLSQVELALRREDNLRSREDGEF